VGSNMIEISKGEPDVAARILVVGVGGGGNNAVDRMITSGVTGVEFVCINTDKQQLRNCKAEQCIQIGEKLTRGLGAGADPEKGEKAAEENKDELAEVVRDFDMVIITCGMGGGTGTGATPIVAQQAKEMGILTVGIVTTPFDFEGSTRMEQALEGIERLRHNVDTLIVISNEKIAEFVEAEGDDIDMDDAYAYPDEVLKQSIQGITDIINKKGNVNLDFADVQKVMRDKGIAHIGMGTAQGKNRCIQAVQKAIESPLLETSIDGASALILNISGDIPFREAREASQYVRQLAGQKCNIIFGSISDKSVPETVTVTIIATGMEAAKQEEPEETRSGMMNFGGFSYGNTGVDASNDSGVAKEFGYTLTEGKKGSDFTKFLTGLGKSATTPEEDITRTPYRNGGLNGGTTKANNTQNNSVEEGGITIPMKFWEKKNN